MKSKFLFSGLSLVFIFYISIARYESSNGEFIDSKDFEFKNSVTFDIIDEGPSVELSQNEDERNDYALFFSIDNYEEWTDLRNPIADSKKISEIISTKYSFETESVKDGTKEQILSKLKEYGNKTYQKNDQLLIYFSGHSHFDEKTKEGFFVPSDAKIDDPIQESYLFHGRLEKIIDNIPCEHILLIFDATFASSLSGFRQKNKFTRPPEPNALDLFLQRSFKYKSRLFIARGRNEIRLPDSDDFANKIVLALQNNEKQDRVLTINELSHSLEQLSPMPSTGEFGSNEVGSNFFFILPTPNSGILKGRIELNEKIYPRNKLKTSETIFDMKIFLKNIDSEEAIDEIEVLMDLPENVYPNSIGSLQIDTLHPSESKEIEFSFFVNSIYPNEVVPVKVKIKKNSSVYEEEFILKLSDSNCLLPTRMKKDYALFFSVSDYQGVGYQDLKKPIQECEAIAELLTLNYGFDTRVVKNPTRQEIIDTLNFYKSKFQSNEYDSTGQFLIFFSGHGEFKDNNGYFIPRDGTAEDLDASSFIYNTWRNKIDVIKCRHILVIIDACFSGTFSPQVVMRSSNVLKDDFKRPNEPCDLVKNYENLSESKSRLFMSSGSIERTPDKSNFAFNFHHGLRSSINEKYISALQVYSNYIEIQNSTKNNPLYGTFGSNELKGEFLFVPMQ